MVEPIPKGRVMPRRGGDLDRDHAAPRLMSIILTIVVISRMSPPFR